jgi:four helix bundle protein
MGNDDFRVRFKKRLYEFTLNLLEYIDKLPKDNISKRIGDQLIRSGTSIIANFIEGQSSSSKKEFINYMNISLKSCNESKLWLSLLKDTKKASTDETMILLNELIEVGKILATIILSSKKNK